MTEMLQGIEKVPTGISGLDEVLAGGLPRGRPTLVAGGAGSGKTMLGMEFIVRGITEFGEPGVFMTFEERAEDLKANFASMGFDLQRLIDEKKLALDFVYVERAEIAETGEYDLEGLFLRLGYAIDSVGAKRVVLDTVESLFAGFTNQNILRAELRRLFRWLKDRGMTAVITGEQGEGTLTRQGLEEYVSDCVIFLDHRVEGQVSTRRLRVVKYRGSAHGTNEYPFLMSREGLSVLPITSVGLTHEASTERISTGIPDLDDMMSGGYYRGSSVLISGTAGTGKSSVLAHFAAASCSRGERCLYLSFEESPNQILRNMRSIGLDLQPCLDQGLLEINAVRPTFQGLEAHLLSIHEAISRFKPQALVIDPISNLVNVGDSAEVKSMLTRVIDFVKSQGITLVSSDLTFGAGIEATEVGVSSLVDTWLLLRDIDHAGERNRVLYILKSRGMAHSHQVREFVISSDGVRLLDPYVGPGEVLVGSARAAQEARDELAGQLRNEQIASAQRELERKKTLLQSQIEALQAEYEAEHEQVTRLLARDQITDQLEQEARRAMSSRRTRNIGSTPAVAGEEEANG